MLERSGVTIRVLIVEDERDLGRLLAYNLEQAGFQVEAAVTAADGLLAAGRFQPDVVLLDLMLPDLSGLEVCRRLRADGALGDAGIIMLTALGRDEERIDGLEAGADDYLVKPFNVKEVVLRVRALARRIGETRTARETRSDSHLLSFRNLRIDPVTHDVRVGDQPLALRPLEFKLLVTLMSEPGKVFTRDELLGQVWDIDDGGNPRTVDVHVRRLRQNLGDHADVVETVPGFGYRARA